MYILKERKYKKSLTPIKLGIHILSTVKFNSYFFASMLQHLIYKTADSKKSFVMKINLN